MLNSKTFKEKLYLLLYNYSYLLRYTKIFNYQIPLLVLIVLFFQTLLAFYYSFLGSYPLFYGQFYLQERLISQKMPYAMELQIQTLMLLLQTNTDKVSAYWITFLWKSFIWITIRLIYIVFLQREGMEKKQFFLFCNLHLTLTKAYIHRHP